MRQWAANAFAAEAARAALRRAAGAAQAARAERLARERPPGDVLLDGTVGAPAFAPEAVAGFESQYGEEAVRRRRLLRAVAVRWQRAHDALLRAAVAEWRVGVGAARARGKRAGGLALGGGSGSEGTGSGSGSDSDLR